MRVLFWTDGFWPRTGGIETHSLQFIEQMVKRGHQYSVVALENNMAWREYETHRNIPIRRFPFDAIFGGRDLKRIRLVREYLEQVVAEFRPDLVHLNVNIGWGALAFSLLKSALRIPVVLTVHDLFFTQDKVPPMMTALFSSVDLIGCVSEWILKEMEQRLPATRPKARLTYLGLPTPGIVHAPLSFSPPVFLLLGRLLARKGFDTAVRAFSLLKKKGSSARLLIAGGGEERGALERLVGELGLTDAVQFMGEVARDDVPAVINQATGVIVPSHFEAFGLVAVEALQMGRPVIASRVGGLSEIVLEGETGLLALPRDPVALCAAMEEFLSQPERAVEMGARGREMVTKRFTLEQNMLQHEGIYRELVR